LTNILIPEQKRRGIPDSPTMDLPARKYTPQLGMRKADVDRLDEHYENAKDKAIAEAVAMRDKLQDEGVIDRHEEKLQLGGPAQKDLEPNHESGKFGPLRPSQNSYIYLTGDVQTTLTFSSPITIATMPSMHAFVSNIGCKCQSIRQKLSSAHQILHF
jgi:hypothetical protein